MGGNKEETSTELTPSEPKSYQCNFCDRSFPTFMALGGHQNRHKEDRARAKYVENHGYAGFYCGLTLKDSSLGLGLGFTEPLNSWFLEKPRAPFFTKDSLKGPFAPSSTSEETPVTPKLTTSKFFGVENFFNSAPLNSAPLPEINVTEDDVVQ